MPLNYSLLILVVVVVYVLQKTTSVLVRILNDKVGQFIKSTKANEKFEGAEFQKEVVGFELVQIKKDHLSFVTKIVGYFESAFFIVLTAIIYEHGRDYDFVLQVVGVWLGLKIFGSYQQWTGAVLGRALFYIFLIGSLFNILFSIGLGIFYSFHS